MSERYSKLFSLPENLCSEGSPVVIAAGALHKDNQTGKVFAQLKLHNIQSEVIQALTVKITPFDSAKRPLGEAFEYQYLDLSAAGNADFGQKSPVVFPDPTARSFSVTVSEVIFTAGGIWTDSGASWGPFPPPAGLETELGNSDLVKQFQIKYGANCKYVMQGEKGIWRCSCGALNREDEKICLNCGNSAENLASVDMDQLKADCENRLESERQKSEEDRRKAEAERFIADKRKKKIIIAASIAAVLIVATALLSSYLTKSSAYDSALALVEEGQYDEALEIFIGLGDFKDSEEQIGITENERRYSNAVKLLENEEYDSAVNAFEQLGDYKDSMEMVLKAQNAEREATYQEALSLLGKPVTVENNLGFGRAVELLESLDGYADSAEIIRKIDEEGKFYNQALEAYKKGDVKPFIEVINTHKYLLLQEDTAALIKFIYSFLGDWKYLSGDAGVLSMKSKEHTDYFSLIMKLSFSSNDGKPFFSLYDKDKEDDYLNYSIISFYLNLENPQNIQIEPRHLYSAGGAVEYIMELTEQDTLLISAEMEDGTVTTCEYQRAAQE